MLGIGLNVLDGDEFPPELRETATSLRRRGLDARLEDGARPRCSTALDRWLDAPAAEVLAAWRERDALRGQEVRWASGEGTAAGIDDTGALLVDTADGPVALDAGEVHLLR